MHGQKTSKTGMWLRIKRSIGWHLYWDFARFLPCSFKRGGKIAKWLRAWCCRQFLIRVGEGANIERLADIQSLNVSIGDRSGIGIAARIHGSVTIGNDVMMGAECVIHTHDHKFDRLDIPMIQQGFSPEKPVTIGSDVWIGDRVVLLKGVTVGHGAIIGSSSVVTKDVPDYAIVCGNPAVVKKFRNKGIMA